MDELDAVATRGAHHADAFHNEAESGIRGIRQPDEPQTRQRITTARWGAKPKRMPQLREPDEPSSSWQGQPAASASAAETSGAARTTSGTSPL